MRLTPIWLTLFCLGCIDRADGIPRDARTDAGAQEAAAPMDAAQAPAMNSGRLEVEWREQLSLPERDLSGCEITTDRQDWTGKSPHTFQYAYEAATRTLKDPTYHTVFDENGHAVKLFVRLDPRDEPTHFISMTYDERGQPTSSAHYTSGTIRFDNEYDEQGRLKAVVVTSAETVSMRETYRYEDPLNPELWSLWEHDNGLDGTIDFAIERTVASDRQTFMRTESGRARSVTKHFYQGGQIVRLEQYGGAWAPIIRDVPDGRASWEWDTAGTLLRYRTEGSWGSDVIDPTGNVHTETFTSGCRELVRHFPWLFHLPGPNSTTLRGRVDDR